MSSPYYSQFGSGHPWGNYFVLSPDPDNEPSILFFYDNDGNIRIREYDSYRVYDTSLPDGDPVGLLRDLQYNINTDTLVSYTWTDPSLDFDQLITLTTGDDVGLLGEDTIRFTDKNEFIDTLAGNDDIYAVGGHDVIYGREGNDRLGSAEGPKVIFGNEGEDFLESGSGTGFLFGGADNDILYGHERVDIISGGQGDDTLVGGSGEDILIDLDGNNRFWGISGDDFIIAGDGEDWITGNGGNDIIHAGGGDDRILGSDGDDTIFGEGGSDHITGGSGEDVIYGGDDGDYIEGEGDNDILYGQGGGDTLKGLGGNDKLFADDPGSSEASTDKLYGGIGEDILVSGSGRDILYGEEGNDLLVASPNGQAVMHGGAGSDTFAFLDLPEGKAHNIEDFTFGEDVINVSDILEGYDPLTDYIGDFVRIFYRDAGRTDIKINADGEGDDWTPLVVVHADFAGTSPAIMEINGDLVADTKLFTGDWV